MRVAACTAMTNRVDKARAVVMKDRNLLDRFLAEQPAIAAVRTPWGLTSFPRLRGGKTDQFVERLRARGVPVRYDVYADEGHGFTKRANELKALKDSAEFLEQRLAG